MNDTERRTTTRHPVMITVELSLGTSLSLYACENLSSGGAFFRHAIPFKVGTLVNVSFTLPGEHDPIRCRGDIANVPSPDEFGMGVKFMGLSPEEEERIEDFAIEAGVRTREPGGSTPANED